MTTSLANLDAILARARSAWRPPPRVTLSEWADREFVLSVETAAEPGRWRTLPYQRGIMDAMTDPGIERVSIMKSSRIGYTLMLSAAMGYYIDQDPATILGVQPTIDDAKEFSKETVTPLLRDVPCLARIHFRELGERGPKDSSDTLMHKAFPGGILSLVGANSGRGFRRKSRRIILLDEVDAYPASAGNEGDPVRLAEKRAQSFWNRKIIAGSTPLVAGSSRIEELFRAGDQRRFYVPCPQCGHMDFLTFSEKKRDEERPRGHFMRWPEGKPREAFFVCRAAGCVIEHHQKRAMLSRGEWRADKTFEGHASFSIWAAYSYAPGDAWGNIAMEFLEASAGGAEKLKTFVNTTLGETWEERGEAPEWERLYQRREPLAQRLHPDVAVITAGVDVQHDRLVYEVVAWGADRQSWGLEAGQFFGDPGKGECWPELDELLLRTWRAADGLDMPIRMLAVDSGDQTQTVYNWARAYSLTRVIACKGSATERAILGAPSKVDVLVSGKRLARGYRVFPVNVGMVKTELYGFLRLEPPTLESGTAFRPGFCHFPQSPAYGEAFFRQLTAEHLVTVTNRRGFQLREWQLMPGRENHWLDARVYARAAAALVGLDRQAGRPRGPTPRTAAPAPPPEAEAAPAAPAQESAPARSGWLSKGVGARIRPGGWLRRR